MITLAMASPTLPESIMRVEFANVFNMPQPNVTIREMVQANLGTTNNVTSNPFLKEPLPSDTPINPNNQLRVTGIMQVNHKYEEMHRVFAFRKIIRAHGPLWSKKEALNRSTSTDLVQKAIQEGRLKFKRKPLMAIKFETDLVRVETNLVDLVEIFMLDAPKSCNV
ncbi:hypothetical protein VNO77_20142 [Canavalia gladiata]|uniref:Uncharacterized protein n=1 Tax=Canavalia gladiata TaxID=3824 RepID=A0AAN9QM54_CANGL